MIVIYDGNTYHILQVFTLVKSSCTADYVLVASTREPIALSVNDKSDCVLVVSKTIQVWS